VAWVKSHGRQLRGLNRRVVPLVLALLMLLGGWWAAPAHADLDFCAGDPIITFNLAVTDITVNIPLSATKYATRQNPVVLLVFVPSNVRTLLNVGVSTYALRTELVKVPTLATGREMSIRFAVYAPDGGPATRYTVSYRATSRLEIKSGKTTSGAWHTASFRVPFTL